MECKLLFLETGQSPGSHRDIPIRIITKCFQFSHWLRPSESKPIYALSQRLYYWPFSIVNRKNGRPVFVQILEIVSCFNQS